MQGSQRETQYFSYFPMATDSRFGQSASISAGCLALHSQPPSHFKQKYKEGEETEEEKLPEKLGREKVIECLLSFLECFPSPCQHPI